MKVAVDEFTDFARSALSGVRRSLIAGFGPDLGADATSEALLYAWRHWQRVKSMDNPAGYLYRVGRSYAVRATRRDRRRVLPSVESQNQPWVEPGVHRALATLSERQRTAVSLVHGYGFTLREVAELWNVRRSTVQWHAARGLRRLREEMGVELED